MTDKEKLQQMKGLADEMYYAAMNMTTDASKLRKAMEKYHQFIIKHIMRNDMEQYISKSAVIAEIEKMLQNEYPCDNLEQGTGYSCALYELQDFLDTLKVKDVNIADMADEYYDALREEAANWMDEGTMGHCRLAYYTGCKDVLNKIQKGE